MLFCNCFGAGEKSPHAVAGRLDLSEWNWRQDGAVALVGEWEMYWEQLIAPGEFDDPALKPSYFNAPSGWKGVVLPDNRVTGAFGYATYRLQFLPPVVAEPFFILSIKLKKENRKVLHYIKLPILKKLL